MALLTIVGLGPGEADDLTRRAWQALEQARVVYLRTERHPCVPHLPNQGNTHSCDDLYEQHAQFEDVYQAIIARVLAATAQGDVVYAVPGDPFVGETTPRRLIEAAQAAGIETRVINGISFIEPMLARVGIDAIDNLQILDALVVAGMHHPPMSPSAPAFISQVYSQQVASDVKLTLMNQYPDEFEVQLIHGAGTDDAVIETVPLYAIDHSEQIAHLTSLYVPVLHPLAGFEQAQEVIAHLRAPEGCPWDRKQTYESLRKYLLEETYEVLETIDNGDLDAMADELGDLLLQALLLSQIATEDGAFYMADVVRGLNEKMIRRHPHVWGDVEVADSDEVLKNWDALKQQEKAQNGTHKKSILDGVPRGLPALMQSFKYHEKAAKVGFDWSDVADVLAKVYEELEEVQTATTPEAQLEEVGDLLFIVVNWARWLGIDDPESALRAANLKFYRRFHYIEQAIDKPIAEYSFAELDALWDAAKAEGL